MPGSTWRRTGGAARRPRHTTRRRRWTPWSTREPTMTGTAEPLFVLPDELAIDTDVARHVIAAFIRGQLGQAGFERAVLGLSGGIDSALVAYLVAEAIGPERLLCLMLPYRTSSEASLVDARAVVAALGCASEVVPISGMVDGYFGVDGVPGEGGAAVVEA